VKPNGVEADDERARGRLRAPPADSLTHHPIPPDSFAERYIVPRASVVVAQNDKWRALGAQVRVQVALEALDNPRALPRYIFV
jgi:hypothetical protein